MSIAPEMPAVVTQPEQLSLRCITHTHVVFVSVWWLSVYMCPLWITTVRPLGVVTNRSPPAGTRKRHECTIQTQTQQSYITNQKQQTILIILYKMTRYLLFLQRIYSFKFSRCTDVIYSIIIFQLIKCRYWPSQAKML